MPYSSSNVARYLLQLARDDNRGLTPMEIIKLTYLAHGWSLGLRQESLVRETAEAWQYGPVFPDLYHKIKHYRASPVQDIPLYANEVFEDDIAEIDRALINTVYNSYRGFNGVQLSAMTHQPGTPWEEAWRQNGKNNQIRDDRIREHYERLAAERRQQ